MKLHFLLPQDCSGKVRWLLNEMNLKHEDIKHNHKNGDLKTPEYLAKNSMGQVPTYEDGAVTLTESYAIVTYLADKYLDKGFAPDPKNMALRAQYYQWLFFSCNSAEIFFDRHSKLANMTDDYRKNWETHTLDKTQKVLQTIEKQLHGRDYILGGFSAVDTCLGYAIDAVKEEAFFSDYPLTKAYYQRLANREACKMSEIFKPM